MSRPNPGQGIITPDVEIFDGINNVKAKIQNKDYDLEVDISIALTMSRPKFRTRDYHLEVEYFDKTDNVKAKIQDKGLSPLRLNIQMQLTCQGQNPDKELSP